MTEPAPTDLARVRDDAAAVARAAGEMLLQAWRGPVRARSKGRGDLVTDLDLRSEAMIRERIGGRYPSHAIVGEEEGGPAEAGELAWYVDPLDGTTNFAHGHPFFCVSVALCHRAQPLAGAVFAPALGVLWSAARGLGATRNGEPCRVSDTARVDDALLSTGFPSWRGTRADNNYRAFLALDAASHGVRRCGAAAIEIAMVADGSYDAFWDLGLKPWDVAAGMLLVSEARGTVTDFDGGPARIDAGRILASNGRIHSEIARGLAGAIPLPPLGPGGERGLPGREEVR
jgi:myo-inositol-1(or 4)-monophosphatase